MDERKLLAACVTNRSAFSTIDKFIKREDMSDRGWLIYQSIAEWYNLDDLATSVDKAVLVDKLAIQYPNHVELFKGIVLALESVSPPNTVQAFIDFRLESLSQRLVQVLASGDRKAADKLMGEYQQLRDTREEALKDDSRILVGVSAHKLVQTVRAENLVKLYPSNLNDAVDGGLPEGAHVLVFAPVETGKTALCVNMAAGMLHDGHRVLYVGNEDPAELMLLRIKSRLSGMTRKEIIDDPQKADELAAKNGFDNLVFASTAPGSLSDVADMCDEYKPKVVFVDQLSNLHIKNLTKVEGLEYLAKGMRNIARSRKLIAVSVTQAADSGIGKLYLDMGDVYFSNVAIQAQVDLMIGIGMDNQAQQTNTRVLNLCKNKLTGNHQPLMVRLNPQLSKLTAGDILVG